jgi:ferredoxin
VCTSTGEVLEVPAGVSLLECLLDNGIAVPNLCRKGVCGECRTAVACGEVDHRDLYLTDEEKESGAAIMPCVSRAAGTRLELFL